MTVLAVTVLVVAKAPVAGLAKTRLAATIGDAAAADLAAAALLDTLDAVAAAPVGRRVVALTGDLRQASRGDEIAAALGGLTVVPQRGADFAQRLANAHADASAGDPVLQIGMDTPQVTAGLLAECGRALIGSDAVLGPATDGGWWLLGVSQPSMAECLRSVPMSQSDTGALTLAALRGKGIDVGLLDELADFDTIADIDAVRRRCAADSRFALAAQAVLA
ncbi:TIGR04282 family arsenosugar biosynthesis glycosyltransferase [Mycolicibacterium sp. XJ1904]